MRVWERAESSASFCGLGGIGGGATFDGCAGSAVSKGEVSRSSGALGFDGCEGC